MTTAVEPETMAEIDLFGALEEAQQQRLARECEWLLLQAGDLIARAGDKWQAMFVVLSGQVRLSDDRNDSNPVIIDTLSAGSAFGESTLFDQTSGSFSAHCHTDVVLLKLDHDTLERVLVADADLTRSIEDYRLQRAIRAFLRATTIFGTTSPRQMQLLVLALENKLAAVGEYLIHQGDAADGLYLLEKGKLRVFRDEDPNRTIALLESGAVVGEIGLMRHEKRMASVVAESPSTVWFLSRSAFDALLTQDAELAGTFAALAQERLGAETPPLELPEEAGPLDLAVTPPAGSGRAGIAGVWVAARSGIKGILLLEIGLASLLTQLPFLLLPGFAKFVLDDVIAVRDDRWLWPVASGMAMVAVLGALAAVCRSYLSADVAARAHANLFRGLLRRTLSLPPRFFDKRAPHDIGAIVDDAVKVARVYARIPSEVTIESSGALYIALLMHYSHQLTAAALLLALANAILLWLGRQHRREEAATHDWNRRRDALLAELLARLRSIRLLRAEIFVRWPFEALLVRAANSSRQFRHRALATGTAVRFLGQAGAILVLFYGTWLVLQGHLTIGELVACLVSALGLTKVVTSAAAFLGQFREMKQASGRIADLLNEPGEGPIEEAHRETVSVGAEADWGVIRFENVWFRYPDASNFVLRGFDCEMRAGERVAILGRSGCGKSTVVKLLLGFYQPAAGRITLDGVDLRNIGTDTLRTRIGAVLQQNFLFRDTIRGNITRGAAKWSLDEVASAARRVGAHDFIVSLPQGYETLIEENGANLSAGEKQRLMIAQALLRDPEILVLDEATSAIDQAAERFLLQTLDSAFKGRSIILVSPSRRAVETAGLILVLENGRVVEQGTHKQLSSSDGLYHRLMHAHA
jgi:ATP-binding cassette subfamily B protein